jgi:hypothetical protein
MQAIFQAAEIEYPEQAEQIVGCESDTKGDCGREQVIPPNMLGKKVKAGKVDHETQTADPGIADELQNPMGVSVVWHGQGDSGCGGGLFQAGRF